MICCGLAVAAMSSTSGALSCGGSRSKMWSQGMSWRNQAGGGRVWAISRSNSVMRGG